MHSILDLFAVVAEALQWLALAGFVLAGVLLVVLVYLHLILQELKQRSVSCLPNSHTHKRT